MTKAFAQLRAELEANKYTSGSQLNAAWQALVTAYHKANAS